MNFQEYLRRYTAEEAEELSRMLNPPPSFSEYIEPMIPTKEEEYERD